MLEKQSCPSEKAQNHELVSPDIRTPHQDIPPELNAICMKAMAYDKTDRYANVLELKKDLQLYLDGKVYPQKKTIFISEPKNGSLEIKLQPGNRGSTYLSYPWYRFHIHL